MLFQVNCVTTTTTTTTVTIIGAINAANINDAYSAAMTAQPERAKNIRVYPLAEPRHGESINDLARHVVRSYEHWERRNEFACENPRKRTDDQRDDLRQTAALAIIETLSTAPDAPMYTVARAATVAIQTYQKRLDRLSERSVEFNPDWTSGVLADKPIRATYPELDRLLSRAIESAHLTERQMAIASMAYMDGFNISAIADMLQRKRMTISNTLYAAQYKIMIAAIADPNAADAFAAAGIDAETLANVLENVKRKARVK